MSHVKVKNTTQEDLDNIMMLWENGEVMKYVGFPNGFKTSKEVLNDWLASINETDLCEHFSIYSDELGYCGEAFYAVDKHHDIGKLDIKLLPQSSSQEIARYALEYAIDRAFKTGACSKVYVEPSRDNLPVWQLYEKLGFIEKTRPSFLAVSDVYLELTENDFNGHRRNRF